MYIPCLSVPNGIRRKIKAVGSKNMGKIGTAELGKIRKALLAWAEKKKHFKDPILKTNLTHQAIPSFELRTLKFDSLTSLGTCSMTYVVFAVEQQRQPTGLSTWFGRDSFAWSSKTVTKKGFHNSDFRLKL